MTSAEFLVMTLLAEEPRSGYDLERAAAERRLRNWTPLGASSVYFLLDTLVRRGLAAARERPGKRGPARRVCALTARGRAALEAAVGEALADVRGPAPEPDLALMNLYRAPGFAKSLAGYARALEARLAETRRARRRAAGGPWALAPRLIFDRHVAFLRAELGWCRRARQALERRSR